MKESALVLYFFVYMWHPLTLLAAGVFLLLLSLAPKCPTLSTSLLTSLLQLLLSVWALFTFALFKLTKAMHTQTDHSTHIQTHTHNSRLQSLTHVYMYVCTCRPSWTFRHSQFEYYLHYFRCVNVRHSISTIKLNENKTTYIFIDAV